VSRAGAAPAAAMHPAMVPREVRGSVVLLALVAQGLDSATAHTIKRPDDVTVLGYETAPDISDQDRAAWRRAGELTDELLVPASAPTSAGRSHFWGGAML